MRVSLVIVLLLAATTLFHRGALIDPMPSARRALGVFAGLIAGGWLSFRMADAPTSMSEFRFMTGLVALPIFCALFGNYCARIAYEYAHFADYTPARSEVLAEVTARKGQSARAWLPEAFSPPGS